MEEILASKIRACSDIKGIKANNVEFPISQCADDMDLYLPYDVTVLNTVLCIFHDIESHTGLTINYDKTSLYRMGSIANINAKFFIQQKFNWTNDAINTLGVELFCTVEEMHINFDKIIIKLHTIIESWKYRSLTLMELWLLTC